MRTKALQKQKRVLGLSLAFLMAAMISFGQYTSTRVAGGASLIPNYPTTAAASSHLEVGDPGPMAVAPNGDIAWSDYYQSNGLVYWDASEDEMISLVTRGSANAGFGGPASAATVGDRIYGVAFDSQSNVYFSTGNQVLMVDMATGIFDLVAGNGSNPGANLIDVSVPFEEMAFNAAGLVFNDDDSKLYVNALGNHQVLELDMVAKTARIVMGTGVRADDGTTGLGTEKDTREPFGIDYIKDSDGTEWLYVCTQQKRVHKYNLNTGIRSLVAGNGGWNYGPDDIQATETTLKQPHDLAIAPDNMALYFGDHQAHVVRKVDFRTGIITKFAGTNESGDALTGNDGPAADAILNRAIGTDFDPDGNMIISERTSGLIRKVDMTTNIISALAGTAPAPTLPMPSEGVQGTELGLNVSAVVAWGDDVYYFDNNSKVIVKQMADGTTSVYAGVEGETGFNGGGAIDTAHFSAINQMILDSNGDIFASDHGHDVIYKIEVATGMVSVVAGTGSGGYNADADGGPAVEQQLKDPEGIAFTSDESMLYINDKSNYIVQVVDMATGNISLFAGIPGSRGDISEDKPLLEAQFRDNRCIAVDDDGNVYVGSSRYHNIYKMDATTASKYMGGFSAPLGALYAGGMIWISDNGTIKTIDPTTDMMNVVNNDVPGSYSLWPTTDAIYVAAQGNGVYEMMMDPAGPLAMIQGYADAGDASALTMDQLNAVGASTIDLNLDAYKVAVADSTAATLPYNSTVQMLVSDVNAQEEALVIAAIDAMAQASDASTLTLDHLTIASIGNVVDANLSAYQAVVADSAGVADKAALQGMIDQGNVNVAVSMIDAMAQANDASALTFALLNDANASGVMMDPEHLDAYMTAVAAADGVADVAALDAIIAQANTDAETGIPAAALAEIDAMAVASDASGLDFALIKLAGADEGALNYDYMMYYQAGVAAADGVADAAALDAIIATANTTAAAAIEADALAAIDAMAVASDAGDLTRQLLIDGGAMNIMGDMAHFDAYVAGVEAAAGVADKAALQAIVDQANLDLAVLVIVGYADAGDAGAMTGEELVAAGVDPATVMGVNMDAYKAAVAAASGTDVDTPEKIQTLVNDTNAAAETAAIATIQDMATNANADELTVDLLAQAGIENVDGDFLDAYKMAIAGAGSLADQAAIQAVIDAVNTCQTVKGMVQSESAAELTIEQLEELGVENTFDLALEKYQEIIFEADTLENCEADLQAMIDDGNWMFVQDMAVNGDATDLSVELLEAVGCTDVRAENLDCYKSSVEGADDLADVAALQTLIDECNVVNIEKFNAAHVAVYPNPSNGLITVGVDAEGVSLSVIDMTGRVVLERELLGTENVIDMSKEANGIYFLKLRSGSEEVVTKLVIE